MSASVPGVFMSGSLLQEVIQGDDGLVAEFREDEEIRMVVHVELPGVAALSASGGRAARAVGFWPGEDL
jgi:hypothetical protein